MSNPFKNPFDKESQEKTQEIITTTMETFATTYPKAYVKAVALNMLEEKTGGDDDPLQLLESTAPEVRKSGLLMKLGAVRKNWKKRWFVVNAEYSVSYYVSEAAFTKGDKPKGTFSLFGYEVDESKKEESLIMLKPEAEDDYAKRVWSFKAPDEESYKQWSSMFAAGGKNAENPMHPDESRQAAFETTMDAIKEAAGMGYGWYPKDSENNQLCYFINKRVENEILSEKVWPQITVNNATIKKKIINKVRSIVGGLIATAVDAAWKAATSAVDAIEQATADSIAKVIEPLGDAINKCKETVGESLEKVLGPIFSKIAEKIPQDAYLPAFKCITFYHKLMMEKFIELADDTEKDIEEKVLELWWKLWSSDFDPAIEATEEVKGALEGNSLWDVYYRIENDVQTLLRNAFKTLSVNKDKGLTAGMLAHDSKKLMLEQAMDVFNLLSETALAKLTDPVTGEIEESIPVPEPMTEFIDPAGLVGDMAQDFFEAQFSKFTESDEANNEWASVEATLTEGGVELKAAEAPMQTEEGEVERTESNYVPRQSIAVVDPDAEAVPSDSEGDDEFD
jgi:hypothetical protein